MLWFRISTSFTNFEFASTNWGQSSNRCGSTNSGWTSRVNWILHLLVRWLGFGEFFGKSEFGFRIDRWRDPLLLVRSGCNSIEPDSDRESATWYGAAYCDFP